MEANSWLREWFGEDVGREIEYSAYFELDRVESPARSALTPRVSEDPDTGEFVRHHVRPGSLAVHPIGDPGVGFVEIDLMVRTTSLQITKARTSTNPSASIRRRCAARNGSPQELRYLGHIWLIFHVIADKPLFATQHVLLPLSSERPESVPQDGQIERAKLQYGLSAVKSGTELPPRTKPPAAPDREEIP